jgi:hypothetical protein
MPNDRQSSHSRRAAAKDEPAERSDKRSLKTSRKEALQPSGERPPEAQALSNPVVPPLTGEHRAGEQLATVVLAKARLGEGDALFIRGEGGGLDWNVGVPMKALSDEDWVWTQAGLTHSVEFKVLLNDREWARGENRKVWPGERLETRPSF